MDHAKIRKRNENGNRLNLAGRIKIYGDQVHDDDLISIISAARWIGNAGSHGDNSLSRQDVYDGFDLLEHIVNKRFDRSAVSVHRLAKRINKRKGPVSKRK